MSIDISGSISKSSTYKLKNTVFGHPWTMDTKIEKVLASNGVGLGVNVKG
jgi:hypothetical protein